MSNKSVLLKDRSGNIIYPKTTVTNIIGLAHAINGLHIFFGSGLPSISKSSYQDIEINDIYLDQAEEPTIGRPILGSYYRCIGFTDNNTKINWAAKGDFIRACEPPPRTLDDWVDNPEFEHITVYWARRGSLYYSLFTETLYYLKDIDDEDMIWEPINTSSSMPTTVKHAIYNLLSNATYENDDNTNNLELVKEWCGLFNITNNLQYASSSNPETVVEYGDSYSTSISVTDRRRIIDHVTVTMGGIDITSEVYDDGDISIDSVTDDISITVTTKIDWSNNTYIISYDELKLGRLSGIAPNYLDDYANRVSYNSIDLEVEYGYQYTVTATFASGVSASTRMGVQQVNSYAVECIKNVQTFDNAHKKDSGWKTNGYTQVIDESYSGYPIKCLWICFETSAISNIISITVTREAVV